MPKIKKTADRLRLLDRMLRSGNFTKVQMLDRIEDELQEVISEKTLQTDLNELRSGADEDPIKMERIGGFMHYTYHDNYYSYFEPLLKVEQMNTLYNAISALKRYKGLELAEELKGVAEHIENRYLHNIEPYGLFFQPEVIEYSGEKHLKDLVEFCQNKIVIKLTYKAFYVQKAKDHIIHPYLVKQSNGRWFLIGHNESDCDLRTYALDRIQGYKYTNKTFIDCSITDILEKYKHIIGITLLKERIEKIVFRVHSQRAGYLKTKPIHYTQQIVKDTDGYTDFQVEVIPNKEFYSLMLSYGGDLELLRPKKVREELMNQIQRSYDIYNNPE